MFLKNRGLNRLLLILLIPIIFLYSYRGAELIGDLRAKQIQHRQEHERNVLNKIKRKMEKIRATQQKMVRPNDKPTHFDGKLYNFYYLKIII